jgi:hypothetical protein
MSFLHAAEPIFSLGQEVRVKSGIFPWEDKNTYIVMSRSRGFMRGWVMWLSEKGKYTDPKLHVPFPEGYLNAVDEKATGKSWTPIVITGGLNAAAV